jgi:hypothetical protein
VQSLRLESERSRRESLAAWQPHLLLLSLVACMAARSQLGISRLRCARCGRSVGAEDVSGAGGLLIGPACMSGRIVISPTVQSMSSPRPARTC